MKHIFYIILISFYYFNLTFPQIGWAKEDTLQLKEDTLQSKKDTLQSKKDTLQLPHLRNWQVRDDYILIKPTASLNIIIKDSIQLCLEQQKIIVESDSKNEPNKDQDNKKITVKNDSKNEPNKDQLYEYSINKRLLKWSKDTLSVIMEISYLKQVATNVINNRTTYSVVGVKIDSFKVINNNKYSFKKIDNPPLTITYDKIKLYPDTIVDDTLHNVIREYLNEEISIQNHSNYELNRTYLNNIRDSIQSHKVKFLFGLNYNLGIGYRNLTVHTMDDNLSEELYEQNGHQFAQYSDRFSIEVGIVIHNKHHVYLPFLIQNNTFSNENLGEINWNTGTTVRSPSVNTKYRFTQTGLGIGYKYLKYNKYRLVNPIFDYSIHYLWLNAYTNTAEDKKIRAKGDLSDMGFRTNLFQNKIGLGMVFTTPIFDFHVMPNFCYQLSTINKSAAIRTHLFQVGLQLGCIFKIDKNNIFPR